MMNILLCICFMLCVFATGVSYTVFEEMQCGSYTDNKWVETAKYTFGDALARCGEDPECVAFEFVADLDPSDESDHDFEATANFFHDCVYDCGDECKWDFNLYVKNPNPTVSPTFKPSDIPSLSPTTAEPTQQPTYAPVTSEPTFTPSDSPVTSDPTYLPSDAPVTSVPTYVPSDAPVTSVPTYVPSDAPVTSVPTYVPSDAPVTSDPTYVPSDAPTQAVSYTVKEKMQCGKYTDNQWAETAKYTFGDALARCGEDPKCVAFEFVAELDPLDESDHDFVATANFFHDCVYDCGDECNWDFNLYVKNHIVGGNGCPLLLQSDTQIHPNPTIIAGSSWDKYPLGCTGPVQNIATCSTLSGCKPGVSQSSCAQMCADSEDCGGFSHNGSLCRLKPYITDTMVKKYLHCAWMSGSSASSSNGYSFFVKPCEARRNLNVGRLLSLQ